MTRTIQLPNRESIDAREDLIELLNQGLAKEYQAIISDVIYSQVIDGEPYTNISPKLQKLAAVELEQSWIIARLVHLGEYSWRFQPQ